MTRNQIEGQLRAALLAIGSALTTWGISDGNQWTPVVGIILAAVSVTWGLLHHKDPNNPGTLSWSLVRKLANALGVAALTYGFCKPDQVNATLAVIAALGPLFAARYSWVSNSPEEDSRGPDGLNLLLCMLAASCLLPGCAGVSGSLDSPYGTITTDAKGGLVITPRATVIRIPINEK